MNSYKSTKMSVDVQSDDKALHQFKQESPNENQSATELPGIDERNEN